MNTTREDEERIFLAALEIDAPSERTSYLNQACGENAELRLRVEALLRRHQESQGILDAALPDIETTAHFTDIVEKPGTVIGPFKLMEKIGEGGFGLVFVAEQHQPIRRKVALKIIKPGMDTREVIARFEAERQALALMDHPNIAKVFDAGNTASGRPYFVMELVRGVPITDFCDQYHQTPKQRLELFNSVCHAIQHAHQKGIIHRDMKPSNVLVTLHDGRPVAKVIDFGVAKALSQQLTDRTIYTQFFQMLGTPLYMSPEQAAMSGLDIDTRSDIYSLGVLLYELLAGTTPFDRDRLKQAALDEIRRIIREEEPPKPSTRLTQSGNRLPSIAALRNIEPAKLTKLIRGDLDWIVMKCLEKDRNRRYETASALAADVERYLNDELVQARPPTAIYGVKKFIRRNKAGVLAGSAIFLSLVLGLILASIGFIQARRQSQIARIQAARSEQVAEFLKGVLATTGPSVARGRDSSLLHEILDKTANRLNNDLKTQPEVQGDVWYTLGKTYAGIGDDVRALESYQHAVDSYRVALGNESTKLALALGQLGRSQSITGHIAIGLTNARLGLQIARKSGDTETLANCLLDIGTAFDHSQVIVPEGEPFLRESVTLWRQFGKNPLALADSLQSLATAIRDTNSAEAESFAFEALSLHRQFLGPEDPKIVVDLSLIGDILAAGRRSAEADAVLHEAVVLSRKILEKDDPNQYVMLYTLAQTLCQQGKWSEVESMVSQAVEAYPSSAGYWGLLGSVSASQGNWSAAADEFNHAVELAPEYSVVVSRLAIANLQAARREQFNRLRHEYIFKEFANEAFRSEHVLFEVSAFLMLPAEGADFERLCRLGDLAASPDNLPRNKYWKDLLRAQTEYRRGEFNAANTLANRIISGKENGKIQRKPHAWFIRAMACAQLHEMESAREAFARGDELLSQSNQDKPLLWHWPDSALAELLRDQAAEMLGITQPTQATDTITPRVETIHPNNPSVFTQPKLGN